MPSLLTTTSWPNSHGVWFLLNIRYSIRPSHYAISLLASVLTSFVSLRQILLHIGPNDKGYGSMVFGLHMYTWLFVVCMLTIIYISIVMSFDFQYKINKKSSEKHTVYKSKFLKTLSHIAFALFIAIIIANIVSLIGECASLAALITQLVTRFNHF